MKLSYLASRRPRWNTRAMKSVELLDLDAIERACQRFGVQRLQVFGSILTDRFDPASSDIDFLVDFLPDRDDAFEDFFGLREELARITQRDVDLVVARSVRNPYFKAATSSSARNVYAA